VIHSTYRTPSQNVDDFVAISARGICNNWNGFSIAISVPCNAGFPCSRSLRPGSIKADMLLLGFACDNVTACKYDVSYTCCFKRSHFSHTPTKQTGCSRSCKQKCNAGRVASRSFGGRTFLAPHEKCGCRSSSKEGSLLHHVGTKRGLAERRGLSRRQPAAPSRIIALDAHLAALYT
jgi:hypothetical protein